MVKHEDCLIFFTAHAKWIVTSSMTRRPSRRQWRGFDHFPRHRLPEWPGPPPCRHLPEWAGPLAHDVDAAGPQTPGGTAQIRNEKTQLEADPNTGLRHGRGGRYLSFWG